MNQKKSKKTKGIMYCVGALLLATSVTGYIAGGSNLIANSKVNFGVTQVQAAENNANLLPAPTPTGDWYDWYDEPIPTPTEDWYDWYDEPTPTPTGDWYDWYDEPTPTPTGDWYDWYDEPTPTPTGDWYDWYDEPTPTPTVDWYGEEIVLGDVNVDGKINAIDFALMRKELLGIDPAFTGNAAKGADVNKDGKFNAIDFAKVRQYLLGIIKNF